MIAKYIVNIRVKYFLYGKKAEAFIEVDVDIKHLIKFVSEKHIMCNIESELNNFKLNKSELSFHF